MTTNIKDRLAAAPEGGSGGKFWKPEKGGMIGGVIVAIREVEGKFGNQLAIDIDDADQEGIITVFASTVIEREVKSQGAEAGDRIGLRFDGQVKNYKAFTVIVEKGDTPADPAPAEPDIDAVIDAAPALATAEQWAEVGKLQSDLGWEKAEMAGFIREEIERDDIKTATAAEIDIVIELLNKLVESNLTPEEVPF